MKNKISDSEKLYGMVKEYNMLNEAKNAMELELKNLKHKILSHPTVESNSKVNVKGRFEVTHTERMTRLFSNEAKSDLLTDHLTLDQFIDSVKVSINDLKKYIPDTGISAIADRITYSDVLTIKKIKK